MRVDPDAVGAHYDLAILVPIGRPPPELILADNKTAIAQPGCTQATPHACLPIADVPVLCVARLRERTAVRPILDALRLAGGVVFEERAASMGSI